jgi:LPXTG-motif cell wall-anchored protein
VTFINVDGGAFGMFAPQEGTTCAIDGDNVVIHYVPKNTTVYGWLHWGAIGDEELTRDITFNEDGTFDITLSKDNCGWALPVAPVKVKDGGTTSAQYYLAIPAEDKLDTVTPDPEPEPDPDPTPQPEPEPQPEDERIDLEIVNTTGMFKALYAYVINGESQSTLVVALTGNTYHYLYKGNYAQAVDNGDDRDQWIAGAQDADGKWTFTFPLAEGETYLPVVSISETYLAAYERGENDLERSFYPRQFVLDLTAKTLTVGDYDETVTVTVVNNAQGVSVADTAEMRVVGGPNSNNFRVAPVLQMLDDTYDQVTFPTVEGRKLTTATADLGADKTFAIDMLNAPTVFAFRDKEPVELQLRVKATGETVTVTMTVDLLAGTITIDGGEAAAYEFTAGADSTWTRGGGDLLLTVKRTADDETTFSRFTGVTVDGKALAESDYTAAAGSVNVTLKSAWLETLAAGSHEITVTFSDGSVTTTLTVREAGPTAPDTGDRTGALVALAGAFLLAAAALVILPARRKEA